MYMYINRERDTGISTYIHTQINQKQMLPYFSMSSEPFPLGRCVPHRLRNRGSYAQHHMLLCSKQIM